MADGIIGDGYGIDTVSKQLLESSHEPVGRDENMLRLRFLVGNRVLRLTDEGCGLPVTEPVLELRGADHLPLLIGEVGLLTVRGLTETGVGDLLVLLLHPADELVHILGLVALPAVETDTALRKFCTEARSHDIIREGQLAIAKQVDDLVGHLAVRDEPDRLCPTGEDDLTGIHTLLREGVGHLARRPVMLAGRFL